MSYFQNVEKCHFYLSAFDPDRKLLEMIQRNQLPFIFHVALYKSKHKYRIDFETDTSLTSFLLFNYLENMKYIWLKNEGRDHIEKITVSNLLEYHYLELKAGHSINAYALFSRTTT